jgi:hypothetical protein
MNSCETLTIVSFWGKSMIEFEVDLPLECKGISQKPNRFLVLETQDQVT